MRLSRPGASGSRPRRRVSCLLGATRLHTIVEEGLDHYAVALTDPEGNEFDIN